MSFPYKKVTLIPFLPTKLKVNILYKFVQCYYEMTQFIVHLTALSELLVQGCQKSRSSVGSLKDIYPPKP